jgi:outer membrane protein TolC
MQLSDYLLKFQMGMDPSADVALSDSLNSEAIKSIEVTEGKPNISNRVEYSILNTQKRIQELDLKRYKVAYYPTIVAYGSLSGNAMRNQFDIFDGDKKWYPIGFIGGTLSITLFDGAQRESKIRQANLSLKKVQNDLSRAENAFTLEALTAQTMLKNALQTYRAQDENLKLATEIVRVAKVKYDQGVGSNLEVVEAETSFREAQTNYYNAMYDVLVTKVDLDRALGSLK